MTTATHLTYQEALQAITTCRCPKCRGLGDLDDAEPGDIYIQRFKCPECQGTGFNSKVQVVIHSE